MLQRNFTAPRRDKNKILPRGVLQLFDLTLRDTYNISKTKMITTRVLLAWKSNSLLGTDTTSDITKLIQRPEKAVLTCIRRQAEPQGARLLESGHKSIARALYEMGRNYGL